MKTPHLLRRLSSLPLLFAVAAIAAADARGGTTISSGDWNDGPVVTGSGHVASETRKVSGFHGVELEGPGDVVVTQGDAEGVVIEAEDNVLPLIETTVRDNGTLRLGFKQHTGRVVLNKPINFKVSAKALDRLVLEGSGSIHAPTLTADRARIELPGSGSIVVEHLKADAVAVELDGSGKVRLAGESRHAKVGINGSGVCDAAELHVEDAAVSVAGSGGVKVWTDKELAVEIGGSGKIDYYGHPTIKQEISGSGKVRSMGEKKG